MHWHNIELKTIDLIMFALNKTDYIQQLTNMDYDDIWCVDVLKYTLVWNCYSKLR